MRKVVASISSELDLDSLLGRVVANAVELLEGTSGVISLIDRDGAARVRAVHNLPEHMVGAVLETGEGITGQVLAARQPVVVEHYGRDLPKPWVEAGKVEAGVAVPVWWQGQLMGVFGVLAEGRARIFNAQDREVMVLPLRARGRTLGTLSAYTHHPDAFHSRQVELLATFANQAAISLDNARLYGELHGRLEEMVGLQRLGTLLLEEHDFDRVLQSLCQQLQSFTDAGGVGLALLEENPPFLGIRTVVGPSADALRGSRIPTEGSFAAEGLPSNPSPRRDH